MPTTAAMPTNHPSVSDADRQLKGIRNSYEIYKTTSPENEIVSWTFNYLPPGKTSSRNITITSEGHRHWRTATTYDVGSIVFLLDEKEFGELDDLNEEEDEEFPDVMYPTAVIYTQYILYLK